ncbi:hypothetical protein KVR01_005660 [Diaporthe batatas]|uniref:uncharacterized protein n=1 Tax=Diaporthe batatas TaxID=748121 RepID=UPI001D05219F|nr:uncharacterized protein KVR01_005660 [Diaporthe batatas]KAG8165385.1 hypothetical protein KVR01_005660 [Diaporthe batatas]
MASRLVVLALAGSMAVAQDMDAKPAGHEMTTSGDSSPVITTTAHLAAADATTASQAVAATTALPTAIMPSDVSDVSGTPTTLVIDTQTPPSPSSSVSWSITTTSETGHMTMSHGNMSGVAGPTGAGSASSTGGVDNVNGAARSVFNKVSIGMLALCLAASAALQM